MDLTTSEIMFKTRHENYVNFFTSEISPKKILGNNVDFLTIDITPRNVRGNDVDFSISKITSKKYVKMTWKFVDICSSMYQRNIHVQSTSISWGASVSLLLAKYLKG